MSNESNLDKSTEKRRISFFWERMGWITALLFFVITASLYSSYLQSTIKAEQKNNKLLDQVNHGLNKSLAQHKKDALATHNLLKQAKSDNFKLKNEVLVLTHQLAQKSKPTIVTSPCRQFWTEALTVPPAEQHAEGQKWGVQHQVKAMPNEVMQGLYQAIYQQNPSSIKGDLLPVNNVSWFDALRFANALSKVQGLQECYVFESATTAKWKDGVRCTGWRLPTEGEWRMLASAGQGTKFSGSDNFDDVAWKVTGELHEVRQKAPNAWGFFDLSGNVREYVWSEQGPVHLGGEGEVANLMDDKFQEVPTSTGKPTVGFRLLRSLPPTSIRK